MLEIPKAKMLINSEEYNSLYSSSLPTLTGEVLL